MTFFWDMLLLLMWITDVNQILSLATSMYVMHTRCQRYWVCCSFYIFSYHFLFVSCLLFVSRSCYSSLFYRFCFVFIQPIFFVFFWIYFQHSVFNIYSFYFYFFRHSFNSTSIFVLITPPPFCAIFSILLILVTRYLHLISVSVMMITHHRPVFFLDSTIFQYSAAVRALQDVPTLHPNCTCLSSWMAGAFVVNI